MQLPHLLSQVLHYPDSGVNRFIPLKIYYLTPTNERWTTTNTFTCKKAHLSIEKINQCIIIKHCTSHLRDINPSHESMRCLFIFYLPIYLFLYHAEKHILVYDFTTVFILVEYKYLHYNSKYFYLHFYLKKLTNYINANCLWK